jgi:hypothetical protein
MNRRTTLSWAASLLCALAPAFAAAQPATAVFVHRTTPANWRGTATLIDHPLANNNPSAIVFVTPNASPLGVTGASSPNPMAVGFHAGSQRWSIIDEAGFPIAMGASFNVRVSAYTSFTSSGRRHRATSANTFHNFTDIDDPAINNNPNAVVVVTRALGLPGDPGNGPHPHAVGVWYNNGKWSIFNEDGAAMPVGRTFNYIAGFGAFVHRALPTNTEGISTFVNHPRTNGRPGALVLTTHNWNPGGGFGIYNDSPLGVRFAYERGQLAIFNGRFAPNITFGAAFNVLPLN